MPRSTLAPLSDRDRVTYLRHLLLPEVGEDGQRRLIGCGRTVDGDPRVVAIATRYLQRSGVGAGEQTVAVASEKRVAAVAGAAELEDAAALLLGAFAATEEIKSILHIGRPGTISDAFALSTDRPPHGEDGAGGEDPL